jgi:hypothetical protein
VKPTVAEQAATECLVKKLFDAIGTTPPPVAVAALLGAALAELEHLPAGEHAAWITDFSHESFRRLQLRIYAPTKETP